MITAQILTPVIVVVIGLFIQIIGIAFLKFDYPINKDSQKVYHISVYEKNPDSSRSLVAWRRFSTGEPILNDMSSYHIEVEEVQK